MDLSIVVCTYNRADLLTEMLATLAEASVPRGYECELIVVDNNSTDSTKTVVEASRDTFRYPVRYILEERQGKSYALNHALDEARGSLLAFTDDDVRVDREWLNGLVNAFAEPDVLAVGGRIIPIWNDPKPKWFSTDGADRLMTVVVEFNLGDEPRDITVPPFGANVAFRRLAFSRYGQFREDLGPGRSHLLRGEDTEFVERLLSAGERVVYAPDAIVRHPVDPARITKEYFTSWYYDYGRAQVLKGGINPDAPRWLGVPRYLFRKLAERTLRWLTSFETRSRFARYLQVQQTLGAVVESRRAAQREIRELESDSTNPR